MRDKKVRWAPIIVGGIMGAIGLIATATPFVKETFSQSVVACAPDVTVSCVVNTTIETMVVIAGLVTYAWMVYFGLQVVRGDLPSQEVVYLHLIEQAAVFIWMALAGIFLALVAVLSARHHRR